MMKIRTSYADVAWFRAKRTGLATPFESIEGAARGILGAQAQIESPARWALALRTKGHPCADAITAALIDRRTLVRAWGQRDTVHVYAAEDWHVFAQAQSLWPASARTGPMAEDHELADFIAVIDALNAPFTRSDLLALAPGRLVDAFRAAPVNNDAPERMAITRLIWAAGREGYLSSVHSVGREQAYAARATWLPSAPWPTLTPLDATLAVIRRYLAAWGPARPADAAHYLGARITDARKWFAAIRDELTEVEVDGVAGYFLMADDRGELDGDRGGAASKWPARLLPAYDTQMMSHADKGPVLHDAGDRKRIWDKAAIVRATIIRRGQFVATWSHKATRKAVKIEVSALAGADAAAVQGDIAEAVARDGLAFAGHLGVATLLVD